MPIDLSAISDALQRSFGEIPPIAIGLILLAGPTLALIGYRLIGVARRMQTSPETEAAPLWVCHDCRSVNPFRNSRCYRCGAEREAAGQIEVLLDQPVSRPSTFEAPAGSPFAALGAAVEQQDLKEHGPGVPVMGEASAGRDAVGVGPGHADGAVAADAAHADAAPPEPIATTTERRK